MDILKLKAPVKDYLWGGQKLRKDFNKESKSEIIAESWELSAHPDGASIIDNEPYQSLSFIDYLEKKGNQVIGKNYHGERFPILNKFIDAKGSLSIQVHPEDDYAQTHENDNGKTEMWYIVDADPDSYIYYGVKESVSKEEVSKAIEEGSIESLLNKVAVKKGDSFFIEAGTIHAIGAGIVIYEVQQNSNVTYRVYDFKRKDKDGKERDLHVRQALEVSNLEPNKVYEFSNENQIDPSLVRLCKSEYFDVFKGEVTNQSLKITEESFQALTFLEGSGRILAGQEINYKKGDSFFIPAQDGSYTIEGTGEFILSSLA